MKKLAVCIVQMCFLVALARGATEGNGEGPSKTIVYESGKQGYHTYRIPALVFTRKGRVVVHDEFLDQSHQDGDRDGPFVHRC